MTDKLMAQIEAAIVAQKKFDEDHPGPEGAQLISACYNSRIDEVYVLLKSGANPNAVQSIGTPLSCSLNTALATQLVKLLLKYGADPNGVDWEGWVPLHEAAWNDQFQAIRILVSHGAVINYKHKEIGVTPLMEAASKGNCESIVTLIELGADPHINSTDGLTALDIAKRDQWVAACMILEKLIQK